MEWLDKALPNWQSYILLVTLSALTAWIITMGVKRLGHDYFKEKGVLTPFWWRFSLRACAALVGLGIGLGLELTFMGGLLGLLSGSMSSLIVMLLKRRLSKVIPEAKDFTGTFSMTLPVDIDRDQLGKDVAETSKKREEEKEAALDAKKED